MASFHLSVKTVQRSAGRSATAAAAYRHAARITCEREGRVHDYRAKQGVEHSFIVAPEDAPAWAHDRQALWNAAEARDTRVNSVTAREWELALPHELDASGRRALVEGFARELVGRYRVAADVAIHAPHREGDQRNWHAHVLTTTRALTRDGLTDKTRSLDAKQTGGPEIAHMRERWASLQNHALERAGHEERVNHRSLAVQRDEARALGHEARADNLDRAPEVKLGPVVSGIERREERAAEREDREYVPLTERGAQVHEARASRSLLAELARVRDALREEVRERAQLARQTYGHAREEGADRISAGLAALRAAAQRQGIEPERGHGQERSPAHGLAHGPAPGEKRSPDPWQERQASRASIKERLGRIVGREEASRHAQDGLAAGLSARLSAHGLDRQQGQGRSLGAEAIRERLEALRERAGPAVESAAGRTAEPAVERTAERVAPQERDDVAARLRAHHEGLERVREVRAEAERHLREAGIIGPDDARDQLRGALDRARPAVQEREAADAHGPEPVNAWLRALLARERSAAERHGPVARLVERARDEPAWTASFRTPHEAQAFREEMERRFDGGTLTRLGQGEEGALAEVAGNRLDGLCIARAWLDAQGEPERSPARMSLAYGIVDAQHAERREREGHEEDGHSWGL